ncbi:DoxX family protein [Nocardiopsis composta]|uniref:Putative oxidoreductase n=1 Tax=Nocardiopsis composta TaxID=157465 RepID=A0A7W8QK12_9ACTN|nr:DoxX family protein [Nocardiopsis composta]MBB5431872.1 putative oxidoreductase [Nocardiopsis composta]
MTETTRRALGPAADATALIARAAIGIVFIAHGWQKVSEMGLSGTAEMMAGMGIPLPQAAAAFAIAAEIGGGALLLLGLVLPLAGLVLAVQMAGAIFFAHAQGPLIGEGGMELPLVLGVAALALGFGGGRFALDRLLPWGRPATGERARSAESASA